MLYPKYFKDFFQVETKKPYFLELVNKYNLLKQKYLLFPKEEDIFKAFDYFDLNELKVIILGQDPYYIEGYANGLAFAVNKNIKIPKSLINIFQEVYFEYGTIKTDRTLISWAKQGILLLNTSLLVIKDQPNSLKDLGWNVFITNFFQYLKQNKNHLVYMLWGNNAKSFLNQIDQENNLVLLSAHPSPLSAKNFFHNNHFKKCNEYLIKNFSTKIEW